jgi:hypothetical protein
LAFLLAANLRYSSENIFSSGASGQQRQIPHHKTDCHATGIGTEYLKDEAGF